MISDQPRERGARRRRTAWLLILLLVALAAGLLLLRSRRAAQPTAGPAAKEVTIASWNVRMLSDRSRDADELAKIVGIVARFDIVAIQEARDTRVLDRMEEALPGWTYAASLPVGRTQKEIYAFFWRKDRVSPVGPPHLVGDPDDLFIREPFAATFRAGEFDFTLCTVHLLYGESESERRRELVRLDDAVDAVQRANGAEDDVILLGDFNFPPDDEGWELAGWRALFLPPRTTTVGDKSLFDNIWFDPRHTSEYTGACGIVRFDEELYGGDEKRAKREVSDHLPVWAWFRADADDDPDGYGDLARAAVQTSPLP